MSVLVVGLSHRTAPIAVLEQAALSASTCRELERTVCLGEHVAEAVVVSTCNRLEVYADVSKFHGGVAEVSQGLAVAAETSLAELTEHLYVHYEGAAVAHLFSVACGLDSMAVGEQQILGQVRAALRQATEGGTVGRALSALLQQALRVGKRAHSETGLDRAGHSLVEAGLEASSAVVGPLEDAAALVVGAGAMSGLAVATLARAGIGRLTVVNRTPERARRLAEAAGGRAAELADLQAELAAADVVISCTGAVGQVIGVPAARTALAARDGRAQVYLDLALPRDVDPAVAALPGVTVVDLERLGQHLAGGSVAAQLDEVRELVAEEVSGYLSTQRAEAVAPTVVALRALAGSVVEAELARLSSRLGEVDERVRAEVRQTVHRVVEKLLHTPTVRVKELAGGPGGSSYAEALRELFGLDPARVSAVSRAPDQTGGNGSLPPAASGQPAPPTEYAELVTGITPIPAPSPAPSPAPITTLRLGTRRSALAITQSRLVAGWIENASVLTGRPVRVELVEITTAGDVSTAPLSSFGGVGVFVSALREALLDGRVDLAVHSLKDLPTAPAPGLTLAAVPQREAPNDVLVTADGRGLAELPQGARIGTGSPRRAAQLRAAIPGVKIVDIRGNVDTRLRLATEGELDAVVLALAGLRRLGWDGKVSEVLPPSVMLPAPGQGALGVECRADDETVLAALAPLEDPHTRVAVTAERALLARLEAGCAAPLGALARVRVADTGDLLTLEAVVADVEAVVVLRRAVTGPADRPEQLGHQLADELIADGAGRLIAAAAAAAAAAAVASLPSPPSPPLAPDPPAPGDGAAQTDRADRTDSGPAATPAGEGDL